MTTAEQTQMFLKALQQIHTHSISCTLSEIKAHFPKEMAMSDLRFELVRNHCVQQGFVTMSGKCNLLHSLTENGEHAVGIYQ